MFTNLILTALFLLPLALKAQDAPTQVRRELMPTVAERLSAIPEVSIFFEAVEKSELKGFLQGTGPFTVLAPSNDYFNALDEVSRKLLFADKNQLGEIVKAWILQGRLPLGDLFRLRQLPMLSGEIRKTILGPIEGVDTYSFSQADIIARNGIIHVVEVFPKSSPSEGDMLNAE